MGEAEFLAFLERGLGREFPGYEVKAKVNLIYRVVVEPDGRYFPSSPMEPKRGQNAFQVDLVVGKKKADFLLPLVAIEVKYRDIDTHSIITYSRKAIKHKEVYPYLRYGMVLGEIESVPYKLFVHNVGLDFALAMGWEVDELAEVVAEQLRIAEELAELLRTKGKVRRYTSRVALIPRKTPSEEFRFSKA